MTKEKPFPHIYKRNYPACELPCLPFLGKWRGTPYSIPKYKVRHSLPTITSHKRKLLILKSFPKPLIIELSLIITFFEQKVSFEKDTWDWIDLSQYCFVLPSGVDWQNCLKWRGPRNSKLDFVIIPVVWLPQPFLKINLNSNVVQSLSCVWLFAILWTTARQVSLVPHCLPESAQVHVHWISDAIQQSHALPPLLLNSNSQRLSYGDWKKNVLSSLTGLSNWIALGIDWYWHCLYRGAEKPPAPMLSVGAVMVC